MSISKIKCTKASSKDSVKVTTRINELFDAFPVDLADSETLLKRSQLFSSLSKGDRLLVNVNGVDTVFTVNRADLSTAATDAFPRKLAMPSVGSPVLVNVKSISLI